MRSRLPRALVLCTAVLLLPQALWAFTPSGLLEIHQINVQQGDCTLIIGPDGTTLLIDAGDGGKGSGEVVPYLQNEVGLMPADGIDYMIATHRDSDHLGGLDEVINAGYDVHDNIWDNGSDKTGVSQIDPFLAAAQTTTAGAVTQMPLGTVIALGDGATATAVAVHADVLNSGPVSASNENDWSVALLVQYKDFDYITAGDLGGGEWAADNNCTGRTTSQDNIETPLAVSLMPGGGAALLTADGVEVLDVNHHGSESSTNHEWMNLLTPALALINTGSGQGSLFHHPRQDVVDSVLLAQGACITAPAALVLQTEEGDPTGSNTSFSGYCVGDITVKTTGLSTYTVDATGAVSQGPDERVAAGLPLVLPMDGASGDLEPPVVTVLTPDGGESWQQGTTQAIQWTATDNVGVTSVNLFYSTTGAGGPFTLIASGEANDGTYDWLVPDDGSTDAFVQVTAFDAAANSGSDVSDGAFTILGTPQAVSLVINEIMQNPASSGDTKGEWVELYNPDVVAVDINGWTLRDNDGDSHLIDNGGPLEVPAGGYLVLGRNDKVSQNGGYTPDYVYSGFVLANGDDEVILEDGQGALVDAVTYTGVSPWPNPNGQSMELIDAAQDNNDGNQWAEAVARGGTFNGSGSDLGTPGAVNSVTGGTPDTEPPVVAVTTPDGGEVWPGGSQQTITWTATDNVGVTSIDLSYSTTGAGGPYTSIATGEANDGSYTWTVPNDPSVDAFVRVVAYDAAANNAADESDAAFTIDEVTLVALHVHGLTVDNVENNGNRWSALATVTVHDEGHNPVAGVLVTGDWSGIVAETADATTDGSGVALVESSKERLPTGSFCFDVTDLALGGTSYDGASDVPQTPPAVCGPSLPVAKPLAAAVPTTFALHQNHPNPFNPNTLIRYDVARPGHVRVEVFDLRGRRVRVLQDGFLEAGTRQVRWDGNTDAGTPVASGVYWIRMTAGGTRHVRQATLIR